MSGAKPLVACEGRRIDIAYGQYVHCSGCAEAAALRERLALTESMGDGVIAGFRERLATAEAKAEMCHEFCRGADQRTAAALADAASLRAQFAELLNSSTRNMTLLRERVRVAEAANGELRGLLSEFSMLYDPAEGPEPDDSRWYKLTDAVDAFLASHPTPAPTEPDGASETKEKQ